MCGLVCLVNKYSNGFSKDQQAIFSDLLFVDYLRGPDSTGVLSVSNKGDVLMAKEASNPIDFMKTKEYNNILNKTFMNGSALVGHNRKATRGTVNDENAHPFIVDDNIILVHNGTIYGDHKKLADVEVDSHAIAHTIHEKGTVTEALSSIDGAYALIWFDVAKGTLNLIRNAMRPLWWMETPSSWIWSSEKAMLEFVAERHNLTVKGGPTELPEDTLQIYTLKGNSWDLSDEKLVITKPVTKTASSSDNYGHWEGGKWVSRFQGQQQSQYQGRRHPYSCAWGEEEDQVLGNGFCVDDVPFRMEMREPSLDRVMDKHVFAREAEAYSTVDAPGTIPFFERELAKSNNKIVTNDEFHNDVIIAYQHGTKVIAETFEYTYANMKDDAAGFYLYSYVCDDPDMIVRQFFDKKYMTEERILQIAGGGYIYEFTIERKRWAAMSPGAVVGRSPGFCIMYSEGATLKYGGGIGDKRYASKTSRERVLQ
jgi:hypothetical protein